MASAPLPSPAGLRRTTRLGGAWQMACDDWLLDQGQPAFRLYRWCRPTLSLGFHQRRLPEQWRELARSGTIELVRRPSGGGAVLHGFGLTYALIWPGPPAGRAEAYRQACQWLQLAFAELGQPLRFGDAPAALGSANCFASSTAADLVDADGHKRVGSAQLWRRGQLLQHGEILLDPPAHLWQALFGVPAPAMAPLPLSAGGLEEHLLAAAVRALPQPLRQACSSVRCQPWRAAELALIAGRLARYRLGAEACLASPEASIERTT